MINSMTGFGRERKILNNREIIVEVRSVNNRFCEFSARTPRNYGYLDERLKALFKSQITRGKVEVSVSIYKQEGADAEIAINKTIAEGYIKALRSVKDEFALADDLSLSSIMRLPDVFTVVKTEDDEEEIWRDVSEVANGALALFLEMRKTEGAKLYDDVLSRLAAIEDNVAKIEDRSPKVNDEYRDRLFAKLQEVLQDTNIDEQRVLTEAAIFADKTAVDEETVRLRSHIAQFRGLLEAKEPVGRKLDFLVQELNREVNTIGSKCQDITITKMVVDMKAEIEKIREQIQNIE
ncbi:YicC/YloC family endoribonuclease [Ruminococcus sp. NK3A76]|uniref:YicC/YloC family endoribonuclease n=1 Tax=Ruminococcus sp. NK3A76 TaxID=877411 RepID=UPI00048AC894|nr:YicC/YloC family endoribonuclease [Ruminococcus sp. NK3A76]